ncbi:MAG: TonB-dependent receptor plug domain-containing protein, partial [Gammaproteobacteria bacterium]|nr:TonB-dependent receptor plug domain-containing protein [Gammaproteobacteria bacterium]
MTIVGTRDDVKGLGGAADVIGQEVLQRFGYADIQRIVRQTPGVSVQVEDGYGLRPNISIRGVASERSGRITLLEDNVLIAPAPPPGLVYTSDAADDLTRGDVGGGRSIKKIWGGGG